MTEIFFYLFAAIAVVPAIYMVVFSRDAVNSAMCLIVTFIGMACLFVMLEAYFIAIIQVLVYAGAVVVLFLFIIMLLDVKGEAKKKLKPLVFVAGGIGFLIAISGVVAVVSSDAVRKGAAEMPKASGAVLKDFGYELFTTYLLPMQVTGFLLLIAMVGVIVLSKRVKEEA